MNTTLLSLLTAVLLAVATVSFLPLCDGYAKPHRPQSHLLPRHNWQNDPNGPVFYGGRYHLFFQYNPTAAVWGDIHWGHAVSSDLVHWQRFPVSLDPTPHYYDENGCWTGSALVANNSVYIIYTGVNNSNWERQLLAEAADPLLTIWNKKMGNPMLDGPPSSLGPVQGFRDPTIWPNAVGGVQFVGGEESQVGDEHAQTEWYMIVGSGVEGQGGKILLYSASSLFGPWEYLHPLVAGNQSATGVVMWECPDFFPLGDRYIAIYGADSEQQCYYMVGDYDPTLQTFQPDPSLPVDGVKLDWGTYYAAKTFLGPNGRRLLFGWSTEDRNVAAYNASGWAGVQTVARHLELDEDGTSLLVNPITEFSSLRQPPFAAGTALLGGGQSSVLGAGRQLEVMVNVSLTTAMRHASNAFVVYFATSDRESTTLEFNFVEATMTVNRSMSSLSPATFKTPQTAPMPAPVMSATTLSLHLIIDHSIVEIFLSSRIALTTRVYPELSSSVDVGFVCGEESGTCGISYSISAIQSIFWDQE